MVTHRGSCHCQSIRFEVDASSDIEAYECNCSICARLGFQHLIVAESQFRLVAGEDRLTSYKFNTRTANHLFCSVCGVKAFYVPRSHPDGYSINVRCLDPATITSLELLPFDGQRWEENSGVFSPVR
ncbi:MAG: GFA family protein [Myxococcota bacterium]